MRKKYNEADYQKLKSEIIGLHLDDKYEYAPMFRLIESRVKDDDTTFLAHCNEEYDKLNPRDKTLLVLNLTRLIDSKDKEVLKQISTFDSFTPVNDGGKYYLFGRNTASSIEEMDS